jgi:hypothetical protein
MSSIAASTVARSPFARSVAARAVAALGAALDLGVEPTVTACRACGHLGMAGATVCGFCWTAQHPAG